MGDPRRLVRSLAAVAISAVLATLASAPAVPAFAVGGSTYVELTNVKRESVGKPPVGFSSVLDQISIERARQLASSDVFEHDMDYIGRRLSQLDVCYSSVGEIIAWERGYPSYDYQRTIDQWWNSEGHHAIMVGNYNGAGGSHTTSSDSGKIYSVMIFAKLCDASSTTASVRTTSVRRMDAGDRYATAAKVALARYGTDVPVVYIASGRGYGHALGGAAVAGRAHAPLLLVRPSSVPASTADALVRLDPQRIVILGPRRSVDRSVARRLHNLAGADVSRLAGRTRYSTAAAVSRATFGSGVRRAYVVNGHNFPAALAGAAVAARRGAPLLLVRSHTIPFATRTELRRLDPDRIIVLGGRHSVSSRVADRLRHIGSVRRVRAATKYSTAVAISRSAFATNGPRVVFLARGGSFPSPLVASPAAGSARAPLLLVRRDGLPAVVRDELRRLAPSRVIAVGGVSDAVLRAVERALS